MIKKKIIGIFIAPFLCFGIASTSFSNVIGSGTFTPVFPGASYNQYGYTGAYFDINGNLTVVDNYFGQIYEPPNVNGSAMSFGMTQNGSYYTGSGNFKNSSVAGTYARDSGQQTLSFNAVSGITGDPIHALDNLIGGAFYQGTLDGNVGYDFNFTGLKDAADPGDELTFVVQMELYYMQPAGSGYAIERYAYSDYRNWDLLPGGGYQTNWAYFPNADSGTYSGSIRFNYPDFGEQYWYIRWDFSGIGIDTGTSSAPVPEPATMLLFGTGLAGLAAVVRRRKKEA